MFAEERQREISLILNEKGRVKVNELSVHFNVSEATIRRDLQEMDSKKLLKKTHGGAVKIDITNFEPSFIDKKDEGHEEKHSIGKYAASMIKDGDTIILDSGTTTLEISKNITAKNIIVITNSIDIASELSNKSGVQLILTGGTLRFTTRAMVGPICEAMLRNFRVDKAFIGANGVSLTDGITTPNIIEVQTKKAMIASANKTILVVDSSKLESVCFSVIEPVTSISTIITSGDIPKEVIKDFMRLGIEFIVS
ncbi:DeoR/GlpR family DNA-binding transcription regulator [Clostridium sp.]|jgi:DeoR family fructose operon transcriptional repressor|uniref:DeoR/GlpR family DNA-binding transcription regulator n=1 Tax=Clostridium sp. TaxID=1506 RepID=UPI00258B92AD|nr:DeoR/GlpR family DNA-binding transcription regulator [Clostridium sp.]MDF2502609.1 transcriptional regulator, DeoR family [Clostridium sp.]